MLHKIMLVCALAGILVFNSGCVYWRLNQFRNQMSAFPEFYRIEQRDVPTIVALRPVLLHGDLEWMSGLTPSRTFATGSKQTQIFHYIKEYADPSHGEEGAFDLVVPMHFNSDGRLVEFQTPSQFAPVITEQVFREIFRPMKDGSIERLRHATGWTWMENRVHIPSRLGILDVFGAPSITEERDGKQTYIFAYRLTGNKESQNPTEWPLYFLFSFDPVSDLVKFAHIYLGRLQFVVDLREVENAVDIKRL